MGFQDYSQLTRDYGDKESRVIENTVGNIVFSGQVVSETAKILSDRFGKVLAETAEHDYQSERKIHLNQHPNG